MKILKTDLLMKMLSKVLQSTAAWNLQDNQRTMQSPIVPKMPYCRSKDTGRNLRNFHTPLLWFGHTFVENIWNQLNSSWSYSLQDCKKQSLNGSCCGTGNKPIKTYLRILFSCLWNSWHEILFHSPPHSPTPSDSAGEGTERMSHKLK